MLNKIIIQGRITNDIVVRRTQNGVPVASFTLAVQRDIAPKNGERETDFIDVVAWNNSAEFVSKYFAKGNMTVVVGRLAIRNWTDNNGNKRKIAEVIAENIYFGESKKANTGEYAPNNGGVDQYAPNGFVPTNEDIPF